MTEIFVSYLVVNGISFTYTAMYVFNTIKFYSEIQHKLGYIWMSQMPSKREIKHTYTYLNTTSEVIGNGYSMYNANKDYKKKEKETNNHSKKKLSHSNNIMGKRIKYFFNLIESIIISRQERLDNRKELRREKRQARIDSYRARLEDEKDKEVALQMKAYGYCRCEKCKTYTAPDKMLQSISAVVMAAQYATKSHTDTEINELQTMIYNKGCRKPQTVEAFLKFKAALTRIEVKCSDGSIRFHTDGCGACDSVIVHNIKSIIELQQKQIDLIYMNRGVIEFEAGI